MQIARSEDIAPGALLALKVGEEEILLARAEDGTLFALRDRCPHQQRSLEGGSIAGKVLTCRHHGVQISLDDGSVLMDMGYIGLDPIPTYAIEERDGLVFLRQ